MKLISELTESAEVLITEAEGGKEKEYFLKGLFMQSEVVNRNNRLYPQEIMEREVNRYRDQYINTNRALGELDHPKGPQINLDRVSHMITELTREGTDYRGVAKILDTPCGRIVKGFMKEGVQLGVSSRAVGSLKKRSGGIMEVQEDFRLATPADIVANPSAPSAFVNGIMEGADWLYDETTNTFHAHEAAKRTIEESTKTFDSELKAEMYMRAFTEFLNSVKQ